MGNQSKFLNFVTFPTVPTASEKTFFPAQFEPSKKSYTECLSPLIQLNKQSEIQCDSSCLCYHEKFIFLSHVIGSEPIITIEEE